MRPAAHAEEETRCALYDMRIGAAAAIEGCQTLYTEGMRHGRIIDERLSIRNRFQR